MIKLNLQRFAGPIPYSITVNGEEYSVARSRDDINTTWEMDASINTDLYTINNNLVVWNDGTILQYNGVDVLPADNIESSDYTTRTASPSYKFQRFAKALDKTITFVANDENYAISTIKDGQTIASPSPNPTATDKEFKGWYDSKSGGNKIEFPYTPDSDKVLFAQFE